MATQRWFKGNLHTHTTKSDGDTEPEHVAEWYREHGYDFLVPSDHNHRTVLDGPDAQRSRRPHPTPAHDLAYVVYPAPVPPGAVGTREGGATVWVTKTERRTGRAGSVAAM